MSDRKHHPRLMMLNKAGGKIKGRAKYHKLLFNYKDEESEDSDITFVSEERGPYDPGLSNAMRRYLDMGLLDVQDDEEPHVIEQSEKGERYMSGFERTKMRLDTSFKETRQKILNTLEKHGDKSASQMVQEENVQEAKENPLRKEID